MNCDLNTGASLSKSPAVEIRKSISDDLADLISNVWLCPTSFDLALVHQVWSKSCDEQTMSHKQHIPALWVHLNWATVSLTHFTIQDGETALMQATTDGHHKVVELLLGAGAKPDLQNQVRTEQELP